MGAINIIIGAFTLIIFLLVFMQPVMILWDVANEVVSNKNTTMYGRDSEGNVIAVGDSLFGSDILLGLLAAIGLAFVIGFIIWASRGGSNPEEEFARGFQR